LVLRWVLGTPKRPIGLIKRDANDLRIAVGDAIHWGLECGTTALVGHLVLLTCSGWCAPHERSHAAACSGWRSATPRPTLTTTSGLLLPQRSLDHGVLLRLLLKLHELGVLNPRHLGGCGEDFGKLSDAINNGLVLIAS
jgi:hypothetical protein